MFPVSQFYIIIAKQFKLFYILSFLIKNYRTFQKMISLLTPYIWQWIINQSIKPTTHQLIMIKQINIKCQFLHVCIWEPRLTAIWKGRDNTFTNILKFGRIRPTIAEVRSGSGKIVLRPLVCGHRIFVWNRFDSFKLMTQVIGGARARSRNTWYLWTLPCFSGFAKTVKRQRWCANHEKMTMTIQALEARAYCRFFNDFSSTTHFKTRGFELS